MLTPANLFRMMTEFIFILLGGFLIWMGLRRGPDLLGSASVDENVTRSSNIGAHGRARGRRFARHRGNFDAVARFSDFSLGGPGFGGCRRGPCVAGSPGGRVVSPNRLIPVEIAKPGKGDAHVQGI
jgi:hypothetical protein